MSILLVEASLPGKVLHLRRFGEKVSSVFSLGVGFLCRGFSGRGVLEGIVLVVAKQPSSELVSVQRNVSGNAELLRSKKGRLGWALVMQDPSETLVFLLTTSCALELFAVAGDRWFKSRVV